MVSGNSRTTFPGELTQKWREPQNWRAQSPCGSTTDTPTGSFQISRMTENVNRLSGTPLWWVTRSCKLVREDELHKHDAEDQRKSNLFNHRHPRIFFFFSKLVRSRYQIHFRFQKPWVKCIYKVTVILLCLRQIPGLLVLLRNISTVNRTSWAGYIYLFLTFLNVQIVFWCRPRSPAKENI